VWGDLPWNIKTVEEKSSQANYRPVLEDIDPRACFKAEQS